MNNCGSVVATVSHVHIVTFEAVSTYPKAISTDPITITKVNTSHVANDFYKVSNQYIVVMIVIIQQK